MRAIMRADNVQVIGDSEGFELHVDTDEGDRFVFRIHPLAEELHDNVRDTIGNWLAERDWAKATIPAPIDLDGYDPNDPKRIALEQETA